MRLPLCLRHAHFANLNRHLPVEEVYNIRQQATGTAHRPAWIVQAQTAVDRNFQLVVYSRGTFVARPRQVVTPGTYLAVYAPVCSCAWMDGYQYTIGIATKKKKRTTFEKNVTRFVLAALSVTSGRGYLLIFISSMSPSTTAKKIPTDGLIFVCNAAVPSRGAHKHCREAQLPNFNHFANVQGMGNL